MVFKNILQVYALVVCLIASTALMIASVMALNSLTDLIIPHYKHYSSLSRFESNERYLDHKQETYAADDKRLKELNKLSGEEISAKKDREKKEFLEDKKKQAIESLIQCLQWIIIASLFFCLHWRLYKKSLGTYQ
jgi:predicted tellurium resistance membrane protein TerC